MSRKRTFFPRADMDDARKFLAMREACVWPNDCPGCNARMEFALHLEVPYRRCPLCLTTVHFNAHEGEFVSVPGPQGKGKRRDAETQRENLESRAA